MDGIQAIHARMAELQRMVNGSAAVSASSTATASKPSGAGSQTSVANSFASVLDRVKSASELNVNAAGAPVELAKYGNGKVPTTALESIGSGDHRLYGPAAQAFKAMSRAASAEGVTLPINDSYRSYDEQVKMAKEKGLYGQGGLAAKPGTSEHGWGLSLDIEVNSKSSQWLKTNAGKYGFANNVAGEPWHWTFKGTK
jgi:D-alanyl-D-alanine carboxypeptidase